jgi:hypothetical protein
MWAHVAPAFEFLSFQVERADSETAIRLSLAIRCVVFCWSAALQCWPKRIGAAKETRRAQFYLEKEIKRGNEKIHHGFTLPETFWGLDHLSR